MKNRQYSLKVFETTVENEADFIAFFETHYLLFKDHLISVQGEMSDAIRHYFETKPLKFLHNTSLPIGRPRKSLEEEFQIHQGIAQRDEKEYLILEEFNKSLKEENWNLKEELKEVLLENGVNQQIAQTELQKANAQIKKLSEKVDNSLTVLDTIIRSGRELNVDGDLLLLNRVNSGATIHTTGNLIVTQVVEGALRCDGNFMMITISPKANIIFNGVPVDNNLLENKLNRIELKNREIFITPVIKKEINWAS